jgi:hypothetical protein
MGRDSLKSVAGTMGTKSDIFTFKLHNAAALSAKL